MKKLIINPNSIKPIYKQIISQVREQIIDGTMKNGERMPSVRSLADDLNISVITVIKAYKELSEESLITAVKGKGYFVDMQEEKLIIKLEDNLRQLEQSLHDTVYYAKITGFEIEDIYKKIKILWDNSAE